MTLKRSSIGSRWSGVFTGVLLTGWIFSSTGLLAADKKPLLSGVFTDNLVLQRNVSIPVWGWAEPGKTVEVSLKGKTAKAVAGADGKWMAKLPAMSAGGPFDLVVKGGQTQTLTNVLLGDVWICSGQSNMEMGIDNVNDAKQEIAKANYPEIRLYTVPKRVSYSPEENVNSRWLVCDPTNIMQGTWGGFSAVAYFFGRHLYQENKVPIGLIHTSWGGTIAEAWTSQEALKSMADFHPALAQIAELMGQPSQETAHWTRLEQWFAKNDPGTQAGWPDGLNSQDWKSMEVGKNWEETGLPDYNGVVWFQKEFILPESWAGKDLMLNLGKIDDIDMTWVNGVRVGGMDGWDSWRSYKVPSTAVKPGRNVITVRALDFEAGGGINSKPEKIYIEAAGGNRMSLAGAWAYKDTANLKTCSLLPKRLDNNPNVVTVLYNGMVAPLVPYAIKGAIWYQGESNAERAKQYRTLLPTMIQDWRSRFGVGEFPFFIVQLANFMQTRPEPGESRWAELREAQALVSQTLPKTGLAVAIDIGDAVDIHPKNKQDVGLRLAYAAEKIAYRKNVPYSGPVFKKMEVKDKAIQISFEHVDGGLVAKGEKVQGFAIAGVDKKFVWADAVIKGKTVVVSSPQVENPIMVRYAWAENPVCNLYNKAGLPAVPFRTDRDSQ